MKFYTLLLASVLWAQPAPEISSTQRLQLEGTITAVQLRPGQRMPTLSIQSTDGRQWQVWLGSMRFLIDNNFTPKAGQRLSLEAFPCAQSGQIVAATITLSGAKTLRLRDNNGAPVWRNRRGQKTKLATDRNQ